MCGAGGTEFVPDWVKERAWACPSASIYPELGTQCLDHEACSMGWPCWRVREVAAMMAETGNPHEDALRSALETWWIDLSLGEMNACIPKAIEYGSTDLAVIGRTQGRLMGRENLTHEEATELGIFFYLMGKIARWEDAIVNGRRVSDDTLHDVAVYTKMMQRTRAVGGWPVAPGEDH